MKRDREMRHKSLLRSPKKEEQQLVPQNYQSIGTLEEIKGFLGINHIEAKVEEDDQIVVNNNICEEHEYFGWDFFSSNWESEESLLPNQEEIRDESFDNYKSISDDVNSDVKSESFGSFCGFWDENVMEDTKSSLNLNLNYEQVLEAWSNRGSLRAHNHHHPSLSVSDHHYMGEVPNLEDERRRRETRVLRYKEKRQSRLFSKKIRYQVRKLNADKRPRLKGRFVKRISDKKL
ncbi:zinc finger protein CONSTANS-LIKE 7 isoform X1 [Spinacia oleracea]|uniref:Zinc finger protein CONSTANS-LIKE 7 isoform X1 n=1 Tax=Spinacia oleracea TaxID=3562 RepID=A0A9R0JHW0_SPIOL|nr:zinc finger protein CONSTANS-LIKE 7 isoform X1 [Spinacia oleracea]